MKLNITQFKDLLLLKKFQSDINIKKLCLLVGFTNLISCFIFYIWLFITKNNESLSHDISTWTYLLCLAVVVHTYFNIVFIYWTKYYPDAPWKIWAWVSLVCVSPLGLALIFKYSNEKIWKESKKVSEQSETFLHSFANSFVNLHKSLDKALEYLNEKYSNDFPQFLIDQKLDLEQKDSWSNRDKFMIIAIHEALSQAKKGTRFDSLDMNARWYDQRYFDFAIEDPKRKVMPNIRYRYVVGFVVLDEFNNYKKILLTKKEIKRNMKFGTAKTICLHWGKGFKVFINE